MKLDETKLSQRAKACVLPLTELQKAVRFFRLYPREHPFCTKATADVLEALHRFLERHGVLDLEIQREGLFLDDALVVRSSDLSTDFSNLLYPEGIRMLMIEPGIPEQEIMDFVLTLASHYSEDVTDITFGNDLLTALWRHDFAHIEYKVYDQLGPATLTNHQDATLKEVADRIVGLVGQLCKGEADRASELDVEGFLKELDARKEEGKLDDAVNWATLPEHAATFLATPAGEARRTLLGELENKFQNDLMTRTADIIVWASLQEKDTPAPADVSRFLAGSTLNALTQGDLDRATDLVARVTTADGGENVIAPVVSERLASAESLQLFVQALESQSSRQTQDALSGLGLRYLTRLDDAAVNGVCQVYGSVEHDGARHVLKKFLSSRVKDKADTIAKLTFESNRRVVQEASTILAEAGRDTAAWKLLEGAAKDAEHPVRAEVAQEIVDTVTGERERREWLRVIADDASKEKRVAAARKLGVRGASKKVFDDLAQVVEQPGFARRDPDEIEAILGALTAIGRKERSIKVLSELSARRTLIFGRRDTQKLSSIAATWLEKVKKK